MVPGLGPQAPGPGLELGITGPSPKPRLAEACRGYGEAFCLWSVEYILMWRRGPGDPVPLPAARQIDLLQK